MSSRRVQQSGATFTLWADGSRLGSFTDRERPYLSGADYGLADIALVPWVLRARDMLGVELDGVPALADWLARLEERPAIAAEVGVVAAL